MRKMRRAHASRVARDNDAKPDDACARARDAKLMRQMRAQMRDA